MRSYDYENDNGKIDHINKTKIDLDVDTETNLQNQTCLDKTMSVCNKQHVSKI